MRVSLAWLADFVELPALGPLCAQLAAAGVEVEDIDDPAAACQGVLVAEVLAVAPHPSADGLQLCRVQAGPGPVRQVVCGAPDVAVGQKVAFAPPGARLPGGPIASRKLRGEISDGMLCSAAELGLRGAREGDGLWQLPATATPGADALIAGQVAPSLGLGITPNRPDLLCHLGVAREVAAASNQRLAPGKWRVAEKGPDVGSLARVVVDDGALARRLVARAARHLKVGPSPAWLRQRLAAVGERSVDNVADVLTYVMWELGVPLHAVDLAQLAVEAGCATLRLRRARAGEALARSPAADLVLAEADLVLADGHGARALAGIVGGTGVGGAAVGPATSSVLVVAGNFDPAAVRRTARRHGLRTEASLRCERGLDPGMLQRAVDRCVQLLGEVAGGEVAKGTLEAAQRAEVAPEVQLRLPRVAQLLGVALSAEAVVALLDPLEIRCCGRMEGALRFAPPSFRPDLTREVDLIEEVARRHGYDRLPERLPDAGGPLATRHAPDALGLATTAVRAAALAAGLSEVVTLPFGSAATYADGPMGEGEPQAIRNPLGEAHAVLRTSLWPGLLDVIGHNRRRGQADLALFEVGRTFHPPAAPAAADPRDRDLPQERRRLAVALTGARAGGRWHAGGAAVDFADLAGMLATVVEALRPAAPLRLAPAAVPPRWLQPGAAAELSVGGAVVGHAGALTAAVRARWDLPVAVYLAQLDLPALAALARHPGMAPALPRFPGTRRDVAVIARADQPAAAIADYLAQHAGGEGPENLVAEVRLFDRYVGKPVPAGHVSLAFALTYRSPDRTLTDDEVGHAFARGLAALESHFPLEIRRDSSL